MRRLLLPLSLVTAVTALVVTGAPAAGDPPSSGFNRWPVGTPCVLGPGPAGQIIDAGGGHHICEQRIPGTDQYYA
ncbi:hypothetical protein [Nocardia gipuzkoensis]|uniref:hypothetical protein n=1 Tax=Nocardia gipuzkoensis TaxID=2749991 RepID=UPI0015EF9FAD|nr:hypothetical protein [Nocardia gipuzkoensis]